MIALTKKRRRRRRTTRRQSLRFTPTAWAKLLFLRDAGPTEVGMFGFTSADELLLIEDVALVRQRCTPVTTVFDDEAVADFIDEQVDLGRTPQQCCRIWLHTHPGDCPLPSRTDEATFAEAFDGPDWSVMFIIAEGGRTYARLKFNIGPGVSKRLDVAVDYTVPFEGSDHDRWQAEYEAAVECIDPFQTRGANHFLLDDAWSDDEAQIQRWHESEWVAS